MCAVYIFGLLKILFHWIMIKSNTLANNALYLTILKGKYHNIFKSQKGHVTQFVEVEENPNIMTKP